MRPRLKGAREALETSAPLGFNVPLLKVDGHKGKENVDGLTRYLDREVESGGKEERRVVIALTEEETLICAMATD